MILRRITCIALALSLVSAGAYARVAPLREAHAVSVAVRVSGRPVCAALEAAHAAGIVNRDIKPDNVFLHQSEGANWSRCSISESRACSTTGDAAPVTQVESLIGTPTYMAPERLLGMPYEARSDISVSAC